MEEGSVTALRPALTILFFAMLSVVGILVTLRRKRLEKCTPLSKAGSIAAGNVRIRGYLRSDGPAALSSFSQIPCSVFIITISHHIGYCFLKTYSILRLNSPNYWIEDEAGKSIKLEISYLDCTLKPTYRALIPPWAHWGSPSLETLRSLNLPKIGHRKAKCIPFYFCKIEETAISPNQLIEVTGEAVPRKEGLVIIDSPNCPMRWQETGTSANPKNKIIWTVLGLLVGFPLLSIALWPPTLGKMAILFVIVSIFGVGIYKLKIAK